MKAYLAYVRISDRKQQAGASLAEQKNAIEVYARREGLELVDWFEEVQTAAKQGRREFDRMMRVLQSGKAAGVVIHKIDRGARNLRDWNLLGELLDMGVDVRFAHESLDMMTRGGRLAADIQAVVAADFIRNLRQETRKGFYGRLKAGLYPLKAPRGYLDTGRAKVKAIDPVEAPIVRRAFEFYATGHYGLETLRQELALRGLTTRRGSPLSLNGMSSILRNPFYMGVIRLSTTRETFAGLHEPLVTTAQFERVQAILDGRVFDRPLRHEFAFRRMIHHACGRTLTGEVQKGRAYYRCHGRECRGVILREDRVDAAIAEELGYLTFSEEDMRDLRDVATKLIASERSKESEEQDRVNRDAALIEERLLRLTDALIDGSLDKESFDTRKERLLVERRRVEERRPGAGRRTRSEMLLEKFELGFVAQELYISAPAARKREIAQSVGSNLSADRNELAIRLDSPFSELVEKRKVTCCDHLQDHVRTPTPRNSLPNLFLETLRTMSDATSSQSAH